jgi:hypothetical protein
MEYSLTILSVDIGLKTLTFYKERFDYSQIESDPPKQVYNKDKSATNEFKTYIKELYGYGKTLFLEKYNLGNKVDLYNGKVFLTLIDLLDDLLKENLFDDVDIILIELQLKKNNIAQSIMHHLYNWCLIMFRDFKQIILYPSKNKTRILGAPLYKENLPPTKKNKITKYERKQWAIKIAEEIILARKDQNTYEKIFKENKKKKDDMSDVIVQTLSYHIKLLLKIQ